MPERVAVTPGIDRGWLEEAAAADPIAHAWALWDLDHAPDRVRFLTLSVEGTPSAYLLLWFGLPHAPVVHWVGSTRHPRPLLDEMPARPMIAIVPVEAAPAVEAIRGPAVGYPLLVMALPREAPTPASGPVEARRLTRADRPALVEIAQQFPALLTASYATVDPGIEPTFGLFAHGRLAGVARVQVSLPTVWIIGGIFTVPEHRGRGFGRALTVAATSAARAEGALPALAVRESNASAVHLYGALGYRTVDRRVWVDAGVERQP